MTPVASSRLQAWKMAFSPAPSDTYVDKEKKHGEAV
jgi:hypothetical protein